MQRGRRGCHVLHERTDCPAGCGSDDTGSSAGIVNENVAPVPGVLLQPQPAAEMLDDLPADRQAESRALGLVGQRVARLAEFLEDELLVARVPMPGPLSATST